MDGADPLTWDSNGCKTREHAGRRSGARAPTMPDIPRDPTEEMHRHAVRTPPRVPRRDADVLKLPRRASIEGLGLGCPADRPALPGPVTADAAATWYRDVFDGLPTATLVTTLDGVVTHANTAAC